VTRKENIMNAATELFARQGFNGTSTSEIARSAGVAQGTIFHHFKNKENLLAAICDKLVRDYIHGIRMVAAEAETGWDAMENILKFSQNFRENHFDSLTVAFCDTQILEKQAEHFHDHFSEIMQEIIAVKCECIERGQSDGSVRQVPVYETALLVHMLLSGILHARIQGLLRLPDLDSEVLDFCRRSLSTDGMT
jgi:AcrR family transcriptional regulator